MHILSLKTNALDFKVMGILLTSKGKQLMWDAHHQAPQGALSFDLYSGLQRIFHLHFSEETLCPQNLGDIQCTTKYKLHTDIFTKPLCVTQLHCFLYLKRTVYQTYRERTRDSIISTRLGVSGQSESQWFSNCFHTSSPISFSIQS